MRNEGDDFITAAQAATILRIDRATVNKRAAAGRIPIAQKLPGRTGAYLFDREVVERIAAERQPVSAAAAP